MFPASLSEGIVILVEFVGVEVFFGLVLDGDVVVLHDGGEVGWLGFLCLLWIR